MKKIQVSGKLMLAGEWAILENGSKCIVLAINKYLTATIVASNDNIYTFNLPDLWLSPIQARYINKHINLITPLPQAQEQQFAACKKAVEVALLYICTQKTQAFIDKLNGFTCTINSEISTITMPDGSKHKPGFGSSAAAIVATIKAILALYSYDIASDTILDKIFKLSILAHYSLQGNCGSGFDVAVATYGATLVYGRFNAHWFEDKFQQQALSLDSINTIIDVEWPDLTITPIQFPKNIMIIVCFSGKSAKTQLLIRDMYHYKQKESKKHTCIISAINEIVRDLERAITASNIYDILNAITMNRIWLQTLAQQSNIVLETPELTRLINVAQKHGAAAKFSGAGGGDCCLALCTDHTKAEKIINEWRSIGALPIEVSVL